MKKLIFLFFVGLLSSTFAQNFKKTESYIQAQNLSQEVIALQSEGNYDPSIEKSPEAKVAIDKAILDSLHFLFGSKTDIAKANATAELDEAKKSLANLSGQDKAKLDEANILFIQAGERQKDATLITDITALEENAYAPAIEMFTKAETLAKEVNSSVLEKEKAVHSALIAEAKKKQADLVTKKILAKGDNNDKTATAALSDADKSLAANNFADVKEKVKTAETALSQAEKAFIDEQVKTKKILDDAQNKFNQLKTTKQIEANSGEDKNITKLLADANASFTANDFKKTQEQVKAALDAMTAVETAFKKDQMDILQAITDASNRQKKLTNDKVLLANGDE
ncbi:MAG: hypothetical protein ACRC5H_00835, partial [Treponemataceae bacterium]